MCEGGHRGRDSLAAWAETKIRVLKVQSGNAFPQTVIWRCPQINRQPSREGWLEKPKLGKAGSVNAIFLDGLQGNSRDLNLAPINYADGWLHQKPPHYRFETSKILVIILTIMLASLALILRFGVDAICLLLKHAAYSTILIKLCYQSCK